MSTQSTDARRYEQEHVHDVYEQIASHFSSTRYKPWPIIEKFLKDLPNGAVGLDAGCGNGKYLVANPNVFIIGSDRSTNLAAIAAKHEPHSAIVADVLELPHPRHSFDFAICIAVVHHLSTTARRVEAIQSVLECLKSDGKALFYVWALEQGGSRRGWTEKDDKDVMVPWVMRQSTKDSGSSSAAKEDQVFHRYYHLYSKGELEQDICSAGGTVLDSGYEKDNWWATCTRKTLIN